MLNIGMASLIGLHLGLDGREAVLDSLKNVFQVFGLGFGRHEVSNESTNARFPLQFY